MRDVIVVGGGPAGLSAALNAKLEGMSVLVISPEFGGRAAQSAAIDNVLAHGSISGAAFRNQMLEHCQAHGVGFESGEVLRVDDAPVGRVWTSQGASYQAKTLIIATGLQWRELNIKGLNSAIADGQAHYGCQFEDASRLAGRRVGILGGANSAAINAIHFAESGAKVKLFIRTPGWGKMSQYLVERILALGRKLEIRWFPVTEVRRSPFGLEVLREMGTLAKTLMAVDTVDELFLFPDAKPTLDFLSPNILKDESGFLSTTPDFNLQTFAALKSIERIPNLYAIGDVRSGSVKRIASAIGEGAAVVHKLKLALRAENLLDNCQVCVA